MSCVDVSPQILAGCTWPQWCWLGWNGNPVPPIILKRTLFWHCWCKFELSLGNIFCVTWIDQSCIKGLESRFMDSHWVWFTPIKHMWFHKGPLFNLAKLPIPTCGLASAVLLCCRRKWLSVCVQQAVQVGPPIKQVPPSSTKCVHQLNKFHHLGRAAAMHCIRAATYSTL